MIALIPDHRHSISSYSEIHSYKKIISNETRQQWADRIHASKFYTTYYPIHRKSSGMLEDHDNPQHSVLYS